MTFAALAALLLAVNLAFAIRSTAIALRSSGYVLRKHPRIRSARATEEPLLSIVVPARNEERQIEQCVQSLLALEYADFEVIAVDDRSTDATLQILDRIAEDDRRLRVVGGEALPPHWVGKPWALVQGAEHARGEWLLFTDADTVHARESAQEAVAYALARRLDVLSLLTDQVMITPAERMFLPSILWTIAFAIGSLAAMNDPRSEAALFNGQYILVRRTAYDAVG
ncbi:MAG TPA: glycosyltransferase, partial [Candidatus Baltobacteraceae bacterium]|nr:glycosyltransferase [Candidatus Baltobacteraceae bacterium]